MDKKSGILCHPTSFPSEYGIGDLGDGAKQFIDFLKKSGQTLWQVLPLGHTSFGDSPYQCFSAFAGNILLISPDILRKKGLINIVDILSKKIELDFEPGYDSDYNNLEIDYGRVINFKTKIFEIAFENFQKSNDYAMIRKYENFIFDNREWLDDYALFISIKNYYINERKNEIDSPEYLKYYQQNYNFLTKNQIDDYFYGAVWNSWEEGLLERNSKTLRDWEIKLKSSIDYYKFLQFIFFDEWNDIKKYANDNNVMIIGDIPIFVATDSADVWANKELFYLDENGSPTVVAGVPPDYFSDKGQLWGNPLYNWEAHKKQNYSFWINRIKSMLSLVDYLRIDHFRGFESYWEVEFGQPDATKGRWVKGPGLEFFSEIKNALGNLPIIAEDLGIITDEVGRLRDDCGFPGMKVLQFGFDAGKRNTNMPHNFTTSNIVVYTGTHDNNTTVGWYESLSEDVKDQFRRYMNVSGNDPSWDLIRLAFLSCAEIAIIPLQDVMSLPEDFRMNIPGLAENCWKFRYTKDMLSDRLAERLLYLSELSDRNIIEPTEPEEGEEEEYWKQYE